MHDNKLFRLRLQLFAEGAADGGEGAVAGPDGSEAGTAPQDGVANQKVSFDQLLAENPEYKEAHGEAVKKAVFNRLKSARKAEEKFAKLEPMLELLSGKYGVTAGQDGSYDLDALSKAIQDDDSYFEQEASERGMTVDALRQQKKLERENKLFRQEQQRNLEEEHRRSFFEGLSKQADTLKQKVPSFDLRAALQDDTFCRMVNVGVPVEAAYFAMNHEGLMSGAMEHAAKQAKEAAAKSVQAGAARPRENGAGGAAAVDASTAGAFTREKRAEIRRRVLRGERVEM